MKYPTRYLKSTHSTNDDAMSWGLDGASHGSAVVAEVQRSGRGRLGRQWFSPPGRNLYCSLIVKPRIDPGDYPGLTLVTGLAIAEYLQSFCGIELGLKWPNDLFAGGKKCGGILCESSLCSNYRKSFAVIGIGLNVNTTSEELPPELIDTATSLFIEGYPDIKPRTIFPELRIKLLDSLQEYELDGFSRILERWKKRDILIGRKMKWVNTNGKVVSGRSLGPDENGLLHIIDSDGLEQQVISGDILLAEK